MSDDLLKAQVNALIRDEIQEVINDYVDHKDSADGGGVGFVKAAEEDQLRVNISEAEVEKLIKKYKKIKRSEKSNLNQVKKLGLVDKNGRPL